MHFKLIIALTEDSITDKIVEAARNCGATGSTVETCWISFARSVDSNACRSVNNSYSVMPNEYTSVR